MTFLAGQTGTAAAFNAAFSAITTLTARQTAQVNRTDAVFTNLTGMAVTAAANTVYRFRARFLVTGANATHDVKFQMSMPAGATIEWSVYAGNTAIAANPMSIDIGSATTTHSRGTVAGTLTYVAEGVITIAGTAGTVQAQGAQVTADPGTCAFLVGSVMSLEPWV